MKEAGQHRGQGTKGERHSHHQRTPSCRVVGLLLPASLYFLRKVSGIPPPQAPNSIDDERVDRLANIHARQLQSRSTFPSTFSSTSDSTGREWFYYNYPSPDYDEVCDPQFVGNGKCEWDFNFEICDFDGGDCCEETCFDESSGLYKCGISGYDCWDPDQERETTMVSAYSTSDYVLTCIDIWMSDGDCDSQNNREECAYDGGDCCQESCVDARYICGIARGCDHCGNSTIDLDCKDPSIATPAPTPTLFNRTCDDLDHIGDGQCDHEYNVELCSFDGGDCCAPTCNGWSCGRDGYDCLDPETDDYGPDCNMEYIGDGECDLDTNTQECHYDGGDCCEVTCVDSEFACDDFDCQDPHASNTAADTAAATSTMSNDFVVYAAWLMMWAGWACCA